MTARRFLVAALLILAQGGCLSASSTRYPYYLAPAQEGASAVSRCLLLPLNFNVRLPPGQVEGKKRLQVQLERYLERDGRVVETLELLQAKSSWREVSRAEGIKGLGSKPDPAAFERAQSALATRLAQQNEFDAVIFPSIQMRPTVVRSRTVFWDGVKQDIQAVNPPVGSKTQDRGIGGVGTFVFDFSENNEPALSLHVAIYDSAGQRLFESYGGLDFPLHAVFDPSFRYKMRARPGLLSDPEILWRGTAIAFDPFLPESKMPPVTAR